VTNNIGRDAAILTVSKIITILISTISAMLLSRFRTLDEYGTYSQLIMLTILASSLFTLGLPSSMNFFLARTDIPAKRRRLLSVFYSLYTIISVVIGIALVLTVPLSGSYFKNPALGSFAFFLAVFPWTSVIISSISNVLVVYGRTKKLMLLNIVNSLVSLSAIILVQIFRWSFKEYLIIYLIGQSLVAVWVYVIVYKLEGYLCFSLDKSAIKAILIYSIPIGLAALVGTISIEIDKLMIGRFFDTKALAIYANAGKELPLTIVSASFTSVLLPQLARKLKDGDVNGVIDLWGYSIRLSYIIICFFTMACIVFAPQIISVLYSNKYLPGVGVFRIYSLVMLLRVTYFGIILNSVGKTKFILYCSIASLILNAALNYLFYLAFGFVGPALATLISIGFINGMQLIVSAKVLHIEFRKLFPWNSLGKTTLINIVVGGFLFILTKLLNLRTDAKGNIAAIALGIIAMFIYALFSKHNFLNLWHRLNGRILDEDKGQ
jgi:O-antigen/teichoic acid export membrane protein